MMALLCAAASGVRENLNGGCVKWAYVFAISVDMVMAWRLCDASRVASVG